MTDESRAVIFGRDADAYELARPTYPAESVSHVLSLTEVEAALEVGAGTGKATTTFADHGINIHCLEPSAQMAAVLEDKELPRVTVTISTFEGWDPGSETFDLVYAAQAWHWVDPDSGFAKALDVLRPGGVLALIWNIPLDRYARHESAYARFAPQLLDERDERIRRRDDHDWCRDMEVAGFGNTRRFTHAWSRRLSSPEYRALYSTYSDHMLLDEPVRTRLLDALADDVDQWGGVAEVSYRTEVFSGQKADTGRQ